jgi:hypothetical protein
MNGSERIDARSPAYNSTYKKLVVRWLNEALCFVSSLVVVESFVLRNRQLLVAANRWWQFFDSSQIDKTHMTIHKKIFSIFLFFTIQSIIAQNIKYADDFLITNKNSLPKVLLVGTFHFEYYNLDAHKVDKDKQIDILNDKKQIELKELLDYISIFKLTKICIEAFPEWNTVKKYNEYKAGQKQLVKDERYQIAFKLMERFKLDTAYSINA